MKYISVLFTFLILGCLACDAPGTDIVFQDIFLELDAATTVTGEQTFTYKKILDGQPTPSRFIVNLAAAQQATPITFTFEIEENSTAILGEHFEISSNSATISANASSVELPINILDDQIEIGDSWTIVIKISSTDVPVNPNYEMGTHIIEVVE
ncbi:MAG: hypothetical protein AAGJ18_14950 [Bacteroidota bacterium]